MKTFISLLRGVNVSGQNKIRMPELKGVYESMGLVNVETYIQSGNVLFDTSDQEPVPLAAAIEAGINRSFGTSVQVLLRDAALLKRILTGNPFINQRLEHSEKLHVTFLSAQPSGSALSSLPPQAETDHPGAGNVDEFLVNGKEIYLFCPNGYGRTRLSNNFFERKLHVSATTRNWKTVNALYTLALQRQP